MHRSGNTQILMLLICFVLATAVFSYMAYVTSEQVTMFQSGSSDGDIRPSESLNSELSKIATLKRENDELDTQIEMLEKRKHQLNLELAVYATFIKDGNLIGGENGNKNLWEHVRRNVQFDETRLDSISKKYSDPTMHEFRFLNDFIADQRDAVEDVLSAIAEEEDRFNNTRDRLLDELDKISDRRSQMDKEHRNRYSELATNKTAIEEEIRDLLELDLRWLKEVKSDGRLLDVSRQAAQIVINRGKKDGIIPGLKFEVFNLELGKHVTKGHAEVVEVQEEIATLRILQENNQDSNPISRGDHVGNPVFNQVRPQVFVLAGEFQKFNRRDLAYFIEKTGGRVTTELGPNVDFLVAGSASDPEQNTAREYHVIAMHEEDLLRFVQTTFGPKEEAGAIGDL